MKYSVTKYEAAVNAVAPSFTDWTSAENWVLIQLSTLSETFVSQSSEEEFVNYFLEILELQKNSVAEFGCEPGSVLTSLIVDS